MMRTVAPFSSRSIITAPRLDARQPDLPAFLHDAFARKDQIAVPAMAEIVVWTMQRDKVGAFVQRVEIEQAVPVSEPFVRLLKRDDIGVQFDHHVSGALRHEASVRPHAFMDVVGRDRRAMVAVEFDVARRTLAEGGHQ